MRMMKVLTATTAFVAVAAASNAAVITTSQTGTIYTSTTAGATQISGTNVVVSSTDTVSATVEISGSTTAKNTVEVGTGTFLVGSGSNAVISATSAMNPGANAIIGVSGTIANTVTNGKAIDLSLMTSTSSTVSIVSGTVSGSITLTEATTGDLLTISGTSIVNGNINTGTGTDVVNIVSGTVNGNLSLGADADSLNLSGGLINGNIDAGTGNDAIVITGGVVSGTIDGGTNTDSLTFNTGGTYTTRGVINNVETITVSNGTTLNLNHLTNNTPNTLNINGRLNLGQSDDFGAVALASTGTLDLGSATLSANTGSFALGSNIRTTVSDSTHIGKLLLSGDNINDINNASLTVVMSNVGYIANGTSATIVSGNAANTVLPRLLTTTQGVYTFTVSNTGTNGDVSLTIGRVNTATLVSSDAGKGVAGVIESVSSSATGDLLTIQKQVSAQTTAAGVDRVVESYAPAVDTGAAIASVNVGTGIGSNISSRLASLRTSGIATGDYVATGHMWVQGFGAIGSQDDSKGNSGFDTTTAGASFGVDTDTLVDGSTVGAAFSYANSTVDSNASNNATTDIDSYIGTLYGSRVYDGGIFVNGQTSFGANNSDTSRQAIGFAGKTKGDYTSYQYGAKVEAGRDLAVGSMVLTPIGSLQYTYLNGDKYRETGPAALNVDVNSFSTLDAGLGANLGWNLPLEGGATLRPNVRAKYVYRMGDNQGETTSRFVAGGAAFNTSGVEADRSSVNLGTGVTLATAGNTELSADYDADIRSSYVGHTGQLKLRWAF